MTSLSGMRATAASAVTEGPKPETAARDPFAPAVAMFDSWIDLTAAGWELMGDLARETVQAQHAMLHCRSPYNLYAVEAKLCHETFDSWQTEAGRMMQLWRQMPMASALLP